jgi:outer membrane receptor protein involved in Fe transport
VTGNLRASATAYIYRVNGLVEQIFTPSNRIQYVNAERVHAAGVSLELQYRLPARIDLVSSLELQQARFRSGRLLANSPGQVGKLRLSVPLWRDRLTVSAGLQAMGQRTTYAGATLPWVILPEAVVSTKPLVGGLGFSVGVRNLSNAFYRDPVGLTQTVDSMIGQGRTYFLTVTWRSGRDSKRTAGSAQSDGKTPGLPAGRSAF